MSARKANRKGASNRPASTAPNATVRISQELAEACDPILAAIERHRAAYLAWGIAGRVRMSTADIGPDYDLQAIAKAEAAQDRAYKAFCRACEGLTTVQPTTINGVIVLFDYVAEFNAGGVKLPKASDMTWPSSADLWPDLRAPYAPDKVDCNMFPFMLMANARQALAAIAPKGGAA